jgi:hypothetical protein
MTHLHNAGFVFEKHCFSNTRAVPEHGKLGLASLRFALAIMAHGPFFKRVTESLARAAPYEKRFRRASAITSAIESFQIFAAARVSVGNAWL